MSKLPYFKFMVCDWLSGDIQMCSMEAQGVFVNLCAKLWQKGGYLPDDDAQIARILRIDEATFSKARAELEQCSIIATNGNGTCYVEFILEQVGELTEQHKSRVAAGRKGGNAKQLNRRSKAKVLLEQKSSNALASRSDTDTDKDTKRVRVVFTPPTPQEVEEYSTSIGYPLPGQAWCDAYEQKGWMVGKNKMKSWKAAIRNWKANKWNPAAVKKQRVENPI